MKIWDKGKPLNEKIAEFTIGNDPALDGYLAAFDVLGSLAHIQMLQRIGLLSEADQCKLREALVRLHADIREGRFTIAPGVEDVHSQIEALLTEKLGEAGKKIHSGRSRNDQVLVDIKLFSRHKLEEIVRQAEVLFQQLLDQSERYKEVLMPGYTHLQVAMPSSFGLWFGAYAESLTDDLLLIQAAFEMVNQNPLGSAAGYGSSFPLDRQYTTALLGFKRMHYNAVYAQMSRGKTELAVSRALASLAGTLSKLAMDVSLFMSQNFGFLSLPDAFTTGSSIMPHKKNPDVFELLRAKCNSLQALPNELFALVNNLPSGYFRDFQMLKEGYLPAFDKILECLEMTTLAVQHLEVNRNSIQDEKYKYLFSVEEVNKLVLQGVPFREAYRRVADSIAQGTFQPAEEVKHTHEGSIGNLCNDRIQEKFRDIRKHFPFAHINNCLNDLLTPQQ